ncbi:nucleolar protein 4 isoform X2 [Lingula anatina]|uniref:Nucleolar protein 4 isoform X2 n=1 Tax=Lingula anatina TaxID=7574 RepID=A0A1S3JT39_LINAN|nr:nucleolar protein 4 isoform X2 [Lingula anatina]|eukprot:XP_013413219.1 nucleolar protein 4 isoform X2 [Lingula anatina]
MAMGDHLENKAEMMKMFQRWASQNYGDSGKTKTVTRKKYERIVRILTGEEQPSSENSKFRFWVKAKGFQLGSREEGAEDEEDRVLHVPTKNVTSSDVPDGDKEYRRVAVVEDFFDIIYNIHVDMEGRGGKHAGQKRTYRAIAETYAFLPREAVTHFLMACSDCQKRMHLGESNNNNNTLTSDLPVIDFSLPITTTYLNHMRGKGYTKEDILYRDHEDSMTSGDSDMSRSQSPAIEDSPSPRPSEIKQGVESSKNSRAASPVLSTSMPSAAHVSAATASAETDEQPLNMTNKSASNGSVKTEEKAHPERKRRASDEISLDSSSRIAEMEGAEDMSGSKDDDDDDDNDDDERPAPDIDPERLKSFNMFVRLFVDENLDRMVPISKQPKDKIQAILEACDRQFPEFHERSRKRVRTYLKSCRRMRRSKENGWEPLRPTPPHLTSAAAESLLAQACENESNNAKRMRMGLEPLPASAMNALQPPVSAPQATVTTPQPPPPPQPQPPQLERQPQLSTADFLRHSPLAGFRPPHELPQPFFANGNGLFRPAFPPAYQHPAHHHPPVIQHPQLANSVQNGPTDLSMKKGSSRKSQLNPSEVATIKSLIAGYRESAAFLYRSADELEQLLLQQN